MYYIGIDTGVHTGVAVWNSHTQAFISIESMAIHQAMEVVKDYQAKAAEQKVLLQVRVEDPRQRTWFGKIMSREEERKKLQGVGSVKRDASIWDDFLRDAGIRYEMVAPKNNRTKLTQETFKAYSGWQKRTNEHTRDAAMLVLGI